VCNFLWLRFQEFRSSENMSIAQILKEWPRFKDPYSYSLVSALIYHVEVLICSVGESSRIQVICGKFNSFQIAWIVQQSLICIAGQQLPTKS
jgi:hypothetical protein